MYSEPSLSKSDRLHTVLKRRFVSRSFNGLSAKKLPRHIHIVCVSSLRALASSFSFLVRNLTNSFPFVFIRGEYELHVLWLECDSSVGWCRYRRPPAFNDSVGFCAILESHHCISVPVQITRCAACTVPDFTDQPLEWQFR